jgi:hypothetical protein
MTITTWEEFDAEYKRLGETKLVIFGMKGWGNLEERWIEDFVDGKMVTYSESTFKSKEAR